MDSPEYVCRVIPLWDKLRSGQQFLKVFSDISVNDAPVSISIGIAFPLIVSWVLYGCGFGNDVIV